MANNTEHHTSVAVIVPCYNVAPYLQACLDSILSQSFTFFKAYVVDDCSKDETWKIINDYAQRDSRIVPASTGQNSGVSAARNLGIELADEQWCIFLDGDDALPPGALETLLSLQRESQADFVCANSMQITEDGKELHLHYSEQGIRNFSLKDNPFAFLKFQNVFCTCWNKLFLTQNLKNQAIRFNLNLRHAQDTLFTHEYLLKCSPVCHIDFDKNVYLYRQRNSSCVHAIALEKRLQYLEILITGLDELADKAKMPRKMSTLKAKEYMWAIRKFSANQQERCRITSTLMQGNFFKEHLLPALKSSNSFRHRLVLYMLLHGWHGAIRLW